MVSNTATYHSQIKTPTEGKQAGNGEEEASRARRHVEKLHLCKFNFKGIMGILQYNNALTLTLWL